MFIHNVIINAGYARSCKELKEMTTIRKDGDYQLQVGTRLVSVSPVVVSFVSLSLPLLPPLLPTSLSLSQNGAKKL